jgi:peptide-methionine (S)-S-oxide reductase
MYRKLVTIAMAVLGVAAGLGIGFAAVRQAANRAVRAGGPPTETATFAGGCFWGLEGALRQVTGVTDTAVGYSGGTLPNPAYEDVIARRTDHLEACRVTFDPARISYEDLVAYFLQIHSPPAAGREVPYLGSPGRLVIFYHDAGQESLAKAATEKLSQPEGSRRLPVVEVLPEGQFYRAEEYHQRYLEKHGLASCRVGS